MRAFAVALACIAASSPAGALASSTEPTASARSVVCPRLRPQVELAFGIWGGPGTSLRREFFAVVGSFGAQKAGGYAIFGSATPSRAQTDAACARAPVPASSSEASLSAPFTYRRAGANAFFRAGNGEQLIGELLHPRTVSALHLREPNGVSFTCRTTNRVVVEVRRAAAGNRLRVTHGQTVLAVASVRANGPSSFRVSSRCRRD